MRVLVASAVLAVGIASAGAAYAADLPLERSETFTTRSAGIGHRVGQMVVYDYHPGVIVRAYWLAPWRNRHYYPTTGTKPEVGRDEDLSAASTPSDPPETFSRSWSTSSAFAPEQPIGRRSIDADPPAEPQPPAPLK